MSSATPIAVKSNKEMKDQFDAFELETSSSSGRNPVSRKDMEAFFDKEDEPSSSNQSNCKITEPAPQATQ